MLVEIAWLIGGLLLITLASDWLVDGASALARRFGVTEFVIGMTVVGFGTSMPELVSSLFSALEGHGDMAIGNVAGSNICNTLLILGVTAMISPVAFSRKNVKVDIPICIAATALLMVMLYRWFTVSEPVMLSRVDGIILLVCFTAFMIYSFKTGKTPETEKKEPLMALWKALLLTILGIAGLVIGGKLFVNHTIAFAQMLHVSDAFISVTLMALGTSLPELATCIVAAVKKKNELALGNIIGSNIFNIMLILGVSATATPLHVVSLTRVDLGVMTLSSVMLLTAAYCFKRYKLDRADATFYLLLYVAYVVWLFMTATAAQ